jgi:hypothetical protein
MYQSFNLITRNIIKHIYISKLNLNEVYFAFNIHLP